MARNDETHGPEPTTEDLLEWLLTGTAPGPVLDLERRDPARLARLAAPLQGLLAAARDARFEEPPRAAVERARRIPRDLAERGPSLLERVLRLLPVGGAIGAAVRSSGTEHQVLTLEAGGWSLDIGQSASGVVRGQLLPPDENLSLVGVRCTLHGLEGECETELGSDGSFRFERVPHAPQSLSIDLAERMLVVTDLDLAAR